LKSFEFLLGALLFSSCSSLSRVPILEPAADQEWKSSDVCYQYESEPSVSTSSFTFSAGDVNIDVCPAPLPRQHLLDGPPLIPILPIAPLLRWIMPNLPTWEFYCIVRLRAPNSEVEFDPSGVRFFVSPDSQLLPIATESAKACCFPHFDGSYEVWAPSEPLRVSGDTVIIRFRFNLDVREVESITIKLGQMRSTEAHVAIPPITICKTWKYRYRPWWLQFAS